MLPEKRLYVVTCKLNTIWAAQFHKKRETTSYNIFLSSSQKIKKNVKKNLKREIKQQFVVYQMKPSLNKESVLFVMGILIKK